MKTLHKLIIGLVCIAFLGAGAGAVVFAGEMMSITGTINDDGQLVDESGKMYTIAEEGKGAEAMEFSGEKLMIEGMVEEADGETTIVIESFKTME